MYTARELKEITKRREKELKDAEFQELLSKVSELLNKTADKGEYEVEVPREYYDFISYGDIDRVISILKNNGYHVFYQKLHMFKINWQD